MTSHVWYASYGSNLSRHRFEHYLLGGTPPGGRRHYGGARDGTPPAEDHPCELPYRLRFGGVSRTWGGGMAYLDLTTTGRTRARMYLLTAGQFADVHLQENGGLSGPADLVAATAAPGTTFALRPGERVHAGGGNYPMVVCCGLVDDLPVFTFTCEQLPRPAPPARAYLRTIASGLAEAHDMTAVAIVAYLRTSPTVRDAYDVATLSAIARAGVDAAIVPPPTHSSPS